MQLHCRSGAEVAGPDNNSSSYSTFVSQGIAAPWMSINDFLQGHLEMWILFSEVITISRTPRAFDLIRCTWHCWPWSILGPRRRCKSVILAGALPQFIRSRLYLQGFTEDVSAVIFLAFIAFTHPICYFSEEETCMNHLMTILERFSCGADIQVCGAGPARQGYIISEWCQYFIQLQPSLLTGIYRSNERL